MDQHDVTNYKGLYIKTARARLQELASSLSGFNTDPQNTKAIHDIFVAAHSLKGESRMMGYQQIAALAEMVEKTARGIEEGVIPKGEEVKQALNDAYRGLASNLESIEQENRDLDSVAMIKKLMEIVDDKK